MRQVTRSFAVVLLGACTLALPGASAADGGEPTFEIRAGYTKAADMSWEGGIYGPGMKNLVRDGNTLYIGFMTLDEDSPRRGSVRVARSRDGGNTWDGSFLVAPAAPEGGYATGASVAVGPDPAGGRRMHVAWGGTDAKIRYAKAPLPTSLAQTPNFGVPVVVSSTTYAADWIRSVHADASGRVHVVFVANGGVYCATSLDYGESWSDPVLVAAGYQNDAASAMDSSGNLYVAFQAAGGLAFTKRDASSGAWTSPVMVGASGDPSIDVYGTYVYVAVPGAVIRSADGGMTWPTVSEVPSGDQVSIAVAPNGSVNVASRGLGAVQLSRSTDQGLTFGAPWNVYLDVGGENLSMPNLATDAASKALVAFSLSNGAPQIAFTREK